MTNRRLFKGSSALMPVAFAAMCFSASPAAADDVMLISSDGTVNIAGEFIEFTDNSYVIRTADGDLRISASRVRCEGDACPQIETTEADVQFAGSDTVGLGIMPLLLEGYAGYLGAETTLTSTTQEGQVLAEMIGDGGFGDPLGRYLVTSTGTSDAFRALLRNDVEVGMAARRILPNEARRLSAAGAGDMLSPAQEHIVAVDSLVVITHPDNPVMSLTMAELAGIYRGEITNWNQVGGPDLPMTVIGREETSATTAVFNARVLGSPDASVTPALVTYGDNTEVSDAVNADVSAIGFVGYAFQRGAKALTLVNECGISMTPDAFSARTEEYSLQRRLYLYNRQNVSAVTQEFLDFALSAEAEEVILKSGFVDMGIERRVQPLDSDRARMLLDPSVDAREGGVMREMLATMIQYDRISTTFRFSTGSSRLDERGIADLERLAGYLAEQPEGTEVLLVGFTDSVGNFESNRFLSNNRSAQVLDALQAVAGDRLDSVTVNAIGYGEIAPSACNISDEGRRINRRVEVWIRTPV